MELAICIVVVYILWKAVRMQTSDCNDTQAKEPLDKKTTTYTYTLNSKTTSCTKL